jgi:uncharacterized membrane protein YdbT with pleckstrin-like domain
MGYKVTQRMRLEADEQPVLDLRRHGFVLFEELLPPLIIWAVPAFLVFCGVVLQLNEDTWATGVALADIAGKAFLLASFLVLPWFGYALYDWYNDSFHITTKRVVRYQQVFIFSLNRTEARLTEIQNVSLKVPDVISNLLNFGTVVIETAAFSGGIEFDRVGKPQMVQQKIFELRGVKPPVVEKQPARSIRSLDDFLAYFLPLWPIDEPDGSVVYHKHWWILLKAMLVPVILFIMAAAINTILAQVLGRSNPLIGLILFVLVFGIGWFQYANWVNDIYVLTEDKIIDIVRIPLIKEDRRVALLERIQNVRVDLPTFWSRLLDMGDVEVETAGKAENFLFKTVHHPNQIADEIQHRLDSVRTSRKQQERQSQMGEVEQMVSEILARQQGAAPPTGAPPA